MGTKGEPSARSALTLGEEKAKGEEEFWPARANFVPVVELRLGFP